MAQLPNVRNNRGPVLYPFTLRARFQTLMAISANGTEQRAASRGVPLFEGVLSYQDLPLSEMNTVTAFFNARNGQFDATWGFSAGSLSFANCKFTQDMIRWTENEPGLYSTTLAWRQTNNAGYSVPTAAASFPNLSVGVLTQRPYGPEWRQLNSVNDQSTGWAYAYKWYAAGLNGFPTSALRRWTLNNPVLPDADVTTILNQFIGSLGMYGQFSLTDPEDATVHPTVRFANDVLEIQYLGFNQTAISFVLEETNG